MSLAHNPSIVTNGLVLYVDAANIKSYPGSGTSWYDLSGNNNVATLTGSPTFGSGSFTFNGTSSYALANSSTSLPSGASARTVSIWFYTNVATWADNIHNLFFSGAGNNGQAFSIDFSTYPAMEVYTWGGAGYDLTFNTTFAQVGWKNITITYNGATSILIYENGIYTKTSTLGSPTNTASGGVYIGAANPLAVSGYFDGKISQTMIYNRALTADEIANNFNAFRGRYGV